MRVTISDPISFGELAELLSKQPAMPSRNMILQEVVQSYLRGEFFPVILPNLYGGEHRDFKGQPWVSPNPSDRPRPYWMGTQRSWPRETFTRYDFLKAVKAFAELQFNLAEPVYRCGSKGLAALSLEKYGENFIEDYIEKLSVPLEVCRDWLISRGELLPDFMIDELQPPPKPPLSLSETEPIPQPANHTLSKREQRKQETLDRYQNWSELAQEIKEAGKKNRQSYEPIDLARDVRRRLVQEVEEQIKLPNGN